MRNTPSFDENNLIDEPGVRYTLHVVLVAVVPSALAILAVTMFLRWPLIPQVALVAAGSASAALVLCRSGRMRLAMFVALLGVTYAVMHAAAMHEGINSIGLSILPVLIVVGGLLLERVKLIILTATVVGITVAMLAIRYFVLRLEDYSSNDMGDLFVFAVTCTVAAVIGRLFAVRIEQGFLQIRDSESRLKRVEEELRRRAEELQKIMDVAPVALFVAHDPECRQVTCNRTANRMLEQPEGANSLSTAGGPVPPCSFFRDGVEVPVHQLPLQTAARGMDVRDSELEVLLPSGRRRSLWGHAIALRDAAGRVRGAIGACQDVTEIRQRADALLRESEERFRNTADAAPVIIWFGDAQKQLTFVNKQTTVFTGVPAEELLGDGWAQVIHPDDLERGRLIYGEAVDRRASCQLEYRVRRADGEYRHMLGTTSPRYVGGEYAGQVGSVIDVTDLKHRQEEDLARQKWESLGTLAGGIAHDFNNLLGGIVAQTELALSEIADGAHATSEIQTIRAAAIRGAEIVRQLMAYAGQEADTLESVDVCRMIEESLDLLKVVVSRHAALRFRLAADVPTVRANAGLMRQILINLAANASEAIGKHAGVIQVSTSRVRVEPESPSHGRQCAPGDYLQLEISDTGCGIPAEERHKIFDPFFSTKAKGRGLGLPVTQGIVRRLGGTINVRSAIGQGTTFQILLPGAGVLVPDGQSDAEKLELVGGTILIVEDEETLRVALSKMLRKEGFTVFEAAEGSEALGMIGAHADELTMMLLDVTLPGVSSPEILREARRVRPELRVIVASAYSEEQVASMFSDLTGYKFLRKPYRIADVLRMLS